MSELKRLPVSILRAFADLFNLIEETGQWPRQITTALVSLIPKGEGSAPLNHRPITVTSTIYRLWACTRLKGVLDWQERWITPRQHGFRPKHSTTTALMELCTKLELALVDGEPLEGPALDFRKCFDLVPQQLSLDLMSALGMDESIGRALQGMYSQITRRFKYPIGVGDTFEATNGILQGCPLSVIIINALLSIMIRAVEQVAPDAEVLAYADDAYLLAKLRDSLQAAVEGTLEFCDLTGMQVNEEKTVGFGTAEGFKSRVVGDRTAMKKGSEVPVPYKTVSDLKGLGVKINTRRTGTKWNKPTANALDSLDRLGCTRLAFETKAHMVSTTILPSCLYSGPFSPPCDETLKKLSTRVTCNLWGPHHRGRSPTAVNTVLLKGHTNDPLSYVIYHSLKVVSGALDDERLRQRCMRIAAGYGTGSTPMGPVGNLVCRWLPYIGWSWAQLLDCGNKPWAERGHVFRDAVRKARSRSLANERNTVRGMEAGADPKTNQLWKTAKDPLMSYCLRRVITGGVPYLSPHAGTSQRSVPLAPEGDGTEEDGDSIDHVPTTEVPRTQGFRCDLCESPHPDTVTLLRHQLYECACARDELAQDGLEPLRDRTGWPLCLELHAILPRGHAFAYLEKLQRYLAVVVEKRDVELVQKEDVNTQPLPWERNVVGKRCPVPIAGELEGVGGVLSQYLNPLLQWLSQLRWVEKDTASEVSAVELAIDFEWTTGKSLGGLLEDRARRIKALIVKINAACRARKKRRPFPADEQKRVKSLIAIGGKAAIGFSRRPIFATQSTHDKLMDLKAAYKRDRITRLRKTLTATIGMKAMLQKGSINR
eukprot:TRINITY_DN56_c0_g1_i8.p1 TRINITY_DN56_c0_g1~~TRINITY_DN56_c0_g1_i8.p1  ORF type:complete len:824 (+),score=93.01 TRINITY_DN56_c0_g1_i8:2709-5180(+)